MSSLFNKILIFILSAFLLSSCQDKAKSQNSEMASESSELNKKDFSERAIPSYYTAGIPVYEKFEDIQPMFNLKNDTTYVVNFWATWCKPCIKEIPYFKELDSTYYDQKIKVVLVSLDFPKDVDTKLVSFAREKQISYNVVVLLDGKYNDWIDKVSPAWSGAIPATYIYNKQESRFVQKSFENTEELIEVVEPFL